MIVVYTSLASFALGVYKLDLKSRHAQTVGCTAIHRSVNHGSHGGGAFRDCVIFARK